MLNEASVVARTCVFKKRVEDGRDRSATYVCEFARAWPSALYRVPIPYSYSMFPGGGDGVGQAIDAADLVNDAVCDAVGSCMRA
jgi:hypothetical protein